MRRIFGGGVVEPYRPWSHDRRWDAWQRAGQEWMNGYRAGKEGKRPLKDLAVYRQGYQAAIDDQAERYVDGKSALERRFNPLLKVLDMRLD